jgi:hypothetical protein
MNSDAKVSCLKAFINYLQRIKYVFICYRDLAGPPYHCECKILARVTNELNSGALASDKNRHYEQPALKQGHVVVDSIPHDWIKGQVTAIETGILSFEAVFIPYPD